jgi:hypothetical protein
MTAARVTAFLDDAGPSLFSRRNAVDAETESLALVKELIQGRTDSAGNAKPGYRNNVVALRGEVTRLQKILDDRAASRAVRAMERPGAVAG